MASHAVQVKMLFTLLTVLLGCVSARVSYDGHQVLRTIPETLKQVVWLRGLETMPHDSYDYDFWLNPGVIGGPVDIRVSPAKLQKVVDHVIAGGMRYSVTIGDVQEVFDEARKLGDGPWDTEYHSFEDITQWMQDTAAANPDFVTMFPLGATYENRTFYGLKITKAAAGAPQIYLDGGIHAREWLAPAVVQYLIGQFVNHSSTGNLTKYLSAIEWRFVPVWNADGYVYTWTTDPNWRKNRQPNGANPCVGTDLCRNAAAGFGGEGSSANPCSDEYHGAQAWSAPETLIFKNYAQNLTKLKGYVNFHSYAQLWLNNYGYTATRPKDYNAQESMAKSATDAIAAVHGQKYGYGPAYTTIYPASGIPSDWTYDSLGVIYSQAIELRGNSFQPPPNIIVPCGEEILAGILVLADAVLAQAQAEQPNLISN